MKKSRTVMIVDDNCIDRETICRYLSKNNNYDYQIFEAECGAEALTKYADVQPELILLDYFLPDTDGLEFIQQLQQQGYNLPPIIILSGNGNEAIAVKAIQSGAYDYCVKDRITAENLNKTINNVLEKYSLNSLLDKNKRQQELIADIGLRILQSLDLQEIFNIAVTEARKLLKCDQILLYRFESNVSGDIVASSRKSKGQVCSVDTAINTCRQYQNSDQYQQTKIITIDDVNQTYSEDCFDVVNQCQAKASAIVPIKSQSSIQNNSLWGLLIAHHCQNFHQWQQNEVKVLEELSLHLSIAIQQAELLSNLKTELAWRRNAETEIQQTKAQLYQANILLERRVEERTKELSEAKKTAEAANKAKDSFMAHMSHELRTPLNGILGFTQILNKDSNLSEIQTQHLDCIYQSGKHLLALINDLLDFSKITANKLRLEPENFDFLAFLNNVANMGRLQARTKGLGFCYQQLSPLPVSVFGDETRLRQILLNLLSNAVKFTESGNIDFTVSSIEDTGKIRFTVKDTGIGIASEQLKTIFLPFEQLSNNHRSKEGTGLGLTISHKIAQLMDSSIQIQSLPKEGSTFWFDLDLPAHKYADVCIISRRKFEIVGFRGQKSKILVVDDNVDNRQVLINWLQPLGFELQEAQNGEQGLAISHSFQPDLILLDLVMPIMDGVEMATKLRINPQFQDTIIFAISANAKFLKYVDSYQIFDILISKPVDLNQLLDLMKTNLALEWIEAKSKKTDANILTDSAMIPKPEEIARLLESANIGDISQVVTQAELLEQENKNYAAFAQQIKYLANNFQLQKLSETLRKNLNSY